MIKRRKTRTVTVGNVKIGSDYPVVIQSMAKTDTSDTGATIREIRELEACGCELVRVAVKGMESARAISVIKKEINIPLVADIHFDHKLALEAIRQGADKVRINPGNITDLAGMDRIIDEAGERGIPVRIGVNSGSLPEGPGDEGDTADRMVSLALRHLEHFRKRDFHDIVISLKASDVVSTVEAYKKMAAECDYPLHLGVTAAGPYVDGIVRSSVGIGALLLEGIGDTIRVSLTDKAVAEVDTAKRILSSLEIRSFGPGIISCPTCGRCQVDLISIVEDFETKLKRVTGHGSRATDKSLTVAIMGCEVNGPGEARDADIGIAFGSGKGAIFRKGEIVKTVDADHAVEELLNMVREFVA